MLVPLVILAVLSAGRRIGRESAIDLTIFWRRYFGMPDRSRLSKSAAEADGQPNGIRCLMGDFGRGRRCSGL